MGFKYYAFSSVASPSRKKQGNSLPCMVIIKDCKLIHCFQDLTQIKYHICLGGKSRLLCGVIEFVLCETGCNFLVFKGRIILSTAKCLRCTSLRKNEPPNVVSFLMFLSTLSPGPPHPPPPHTHIETHTMHPRYTAPACYSAIESVRINCRHCFLCGLETKNCSLTFS